MKFFPDSKPSLIVASRETSFLELFWKSGGSEEVFKRIKDTKYYPPDMLTQQILEEKKFWEDRIGQVARFREYFFVVKQGG